MDQIWQHISGHAVRYALFVKSWTNNMIDFTSSEGGVKQLIARTHFQFGFHHALDHELFALLSTKWLDAHPVNAAVVVYGTESPAWLRGVIERSHDSYYKFTREYTDTDPKVNHACNWENMDYGAPEILQAQERLKGAMQSCLHSVQSAIRDAGLEAAYAKPGLQHFVRGYALSINH